MTDITERIEALGKSIHDFKEKHTEMDAATGSRVKELEIQLDKINDKLTEDEKRFDELQAEAAKAQALEDAVERLEAQVRAPAFSPDGKETPYSPEEVEHKQAFNDFLRSPQNMRHNAAARLEDAESAVKQLAKEGKAVTIGTDAAGGYAVPAPIAEEVFQLVLDISQIINAVRTTNVGTPLYERLVDSRGTASGWAGEGDTRSDTATPTLNQVTFTHGELYALPKISNWALQDMMFDIDAYVVASVAEEFDYQLGLAITSGNGTNKPTGILNGTPVSTDDEASPARAFGTIQYLPTGAAADFQLDRLGSPAGDPAGVFIDLEQALKPRYLANLTYWANRNTVKQMRKWRDADGQYLWQRSLQVGQPATFMSAPVINNEHLADVGTNAFPVIGGDLRAGYELIRLHGMNMIRDPFTSKGHTILYIAQRYGGKIVVDDAIKVIKCAAS